MSIVPYSGYKTVPVDVSAADQVLTEVCRALWVGVSGNIACVDAAGNAIIFTHVPVGFFPMTLKQITHTGTTASEIIAIL